MCMNFNVLNFSLLNFHSDSLMSNAVVYNDKDRWPESILDKENLKVIEKKMQLKQEGEW